MADRIKKDDLVVVISGKDRGQQGRVLFVNREAGQVLVEGVNVVKRHSKPTPQNPEGGIIEKSMPIDISNVMLWDSKAESRTRVRFERNDDGEKVRVSVKTGAVLEN